MLHVTSLLTLIKESLLKGEMVGCDNKSWDNNNNKYQENEETIRGGSLDYGGTSRFNCIWFTTRTSIW